MISIILPVYNEQELIRQSTERIIRKLEGMKEAYEILIVEESTDRTPEIVSAMRKRCRRIRHFHFSRRLGKGRAIEYGVRKSRGEKIIFMDIDLAVGLSALDRIIKELERCDIAVGSRYHPESHTRRTLLRLFLGRSYALFVRLLLGLRIRDFQCGFKGFRKHAGKDVIRRTEMPGVFWDTEFLWRAKKRGYSICEIPVDWEEKKGRNVKIGIKTIFYMWASLLRLFFSSRLSKG